MALWEEASSLSRMDLTTQQSAHCEGVYGDKNKWGVSEVLLPSNRTGLKMEVITKARNQVTCEQNNS